MTKRGAQDQAGGARTRRFRPWVVPVLILLLGALAAWGVFAWRSRVNDQETQQRLETAARDAGRRVAQGLDDYAALLQDTAAFWSVNPDVTPTEVAAYGDQLDLARRYEPLEDVSLVRYVPADQLDEFVASQQAVTPGFTITPAPDGRAVYYPITATLEGTTNRFGVDVGVDEARRVAMEKAAETGRTVMAAPLDRKDDVQVNGRQSEPVLAMVTPGLPQRPPRRHRRPAQGSAPRVHHHLVPAEPVLPHHRSVGRARRRVGHRRHRDRSPALAVGRRPTAALTAERTVTVLEPGLDGRRPARPQLRQRVEPPGAVPVRLGGVRPRPRARRARPGGWPWAAIA